MNENGRRFNMVDSRRSGQNLLEGFIRSHKRYKMNAMGKLVNQNVLNENKFKLENVFKRRNLGSNIDLHLNTKDFLRQLLLLVLPVFRLRRV